MMQRAPDPFGQRLALAVRRIGSPVCVGLDPHPGRVPTGEGAQAALDFCRGVIDVVHDVVPAVKPQVAFFERMGWQGVRALEQVVQHASDAGLMVILDAKRGDIGSTARAYAEATLHTADAVTLSPYLGPESLTPFQEHAGKGLFVLVRTSNPGASLWQTETGAAEAVAEWVQSQALATMGADALGDVGAVIGATVPEEAAHWRDAMPNAWLLVPGFGAQGGTATTADPLFRADGLGALVVSARGVLYGDATQDQTDYRAGVRLRAQRLAATFAGKLR